MKEIRRLREEDRPAVSRLHAVVYNFRRNFQKDEKPEPNPLNDPPDWGWGVFENGKMVSATLEHRFLMRFDGHSVPMDGIGGVGTLPEARKGGYVRSIFEKHLEEAYTRGVLFSNLSPFSHEFYRKFGYELTCPRSKVTIYASKFAALKPKGTFTQILPGDDTTELNDIHKVYISDLNHAVCRDYWPDNRAWKIFTENDPYSKGIFIFLWRDENGKAGSYIKYQQHFKNDESIISVTELAFINREALYAVLGFTGSLSAQAKKIEWLMPPFLDPYDFISEAHEVSQEIIPRDMTRVVNVMAALEKMRRPEGEGSYIIETEDSFIDANTGRFLVEYDESGSKVSLTRKEPDLRCDIPVLSQLITGYRTLGNALYTRTKGLELMGNEKILKKVFTLRPQHLTEYF